MQFRYFIVWLVLLIPSLVFAQETVEKNKLEWLDWNEGFTKAQKEKKIALIDAYTDWCGWCKKMDRDTYAKPSVAEKIKDRFVPIKFNPELKRTYQTPNGEMTGRQLLLQLSNNRPSGYPTTFFYLPNKNEILPVPGYHGEKDFNELLDKIVKYSKGEIELIQN